MQLSRDTIQRMISGSNAGGGAAAGGGGGGTPYILPLAADGVRGGIQIGYAQSGRNYPVQLDGEKAYVNVPWTDHYAWADITGKPNTVAGYGITDMGSQSVNYANSAGAVDWANITNKPSFNYLPLTGGEISGNLNVTGDLKMGSKMVATQEWVGQNYLSISFFSALFKAYNGTTEVTPNGSTANVDNIKAMFGFWTEQYISALGRGTGGGGGGGGASALYECSDVNRDGNKVLGAAAGKVLTYGSDNKWYAASIPAPAWGDITGTPTTVSGYGITDAITTSNIGSQSVSYASTSGTATYANSAGSAQSAGYATEAGAVAWSGVSNKPSQIFCQQGDVSDNYVNGTTYSALSSGTYKHAIAGASESMIHFQHEGSASGLDIMFEYPQDATHPLKYRKNIDNNRFASVNWVTIIDSLNIGSQSVNYAASAGSVVWANVSGRPTNVSSFTNDAGYITSSGSCNYATSAGSAGSAGSATYAGYITDGTMDLIAQNDNEINFGGTTAGDTIYFGYRARGGKVAPTGYVFGSYDGTANLTFHYAYVNQILPKTVNNVLQPLYIGASGGTTRVRGNMGVGVDNPQYKLDVSGIVHATTGIVSDGYVTALSDERLKTVHDDVRMTVEDVASMPAVKFTWNEGTDRDKMYVGTLAQSWQVVLPEVVHKLTNGRLTMDYQVAALMASIVTARKVTDHEKRIRQLEQENKELRNLLKLN